jgi:HD superfamily phosphohydrolase YqeK
MAQAHDVARAVDPRLLLLRAEHLGLEVDPVDRVEPVLLHGPVGAAELYERYGVRDERVLHAVHWHTSGHVDYGPEAWAMFVADKVDPTKIERWPALADVRDAAWASLERAALSYLDLLLGRAIAERWQMHPSTIRARNALVARLR